MLKFIWDNKIKFGLGAAFLLGWLFMANRAAAEEYDRGPISVTQERILDAGKIAFEYTYGNNKFDGNVTAQHGFDAKLAPTGWLTLGASSYYADAAQNGFGDLFVYGTVDAGNILGIEIIPSLGLSIPNGFNHHFGFDQISSGTYDLQPAVALITDVGPLQLGAQWVGVYRLDDNKLDFALGDKNTAKAWVSVTPWKQVTLFAFAQSDFVQNLDPPPYVKFANTSFDTVFVGAGARTSVEGFSLRGELMFPVLENYDATFAGINNQRVFKVSLSKTF